jgi:hypothetical protein
MSRNSVVWEEKAAVESATKPDSRAKDNGVGRG